MVLLSILLDLNQINYLSLLFLALESFLGDEQVASLQTSVHQRKAYATTVQTNSRNKTLKAARGTRVVGYTTEARYDRRAQV